MEKILLSKLVPPQLQSVMKRPRLMKQFAKISGQKLTLLMAPAGYGKTVFMAQLVETMEKPLVWYQLDNYDNDPATFSQYFTAGFQKHFPDFGNEMSRLAAQNNVTAVLRLLVVSIVNRLEAARAGLMIALDDYHKVTEPAIHNFVQELLEHLPPSSHIVIACRTPPPFSLASHSLLGEVHIAGPEELRFNRQEINDFLLRNNKQVSENILEAIERKTAGWPVILQLVDNFPSVNPAIWSNEGTEKIYNYLAAEVLNLQPEHVRSFLLGTSVLEELNPSFCNALLERTDSREIIDFLEKQQLFLTPLDDGKTYRYHQLFQEFLRQQLGTKRSSLLRRAGILAGRPGS